MYDAGDIVDGKYIVDGVCSTTGGMGALVFVSPTNAQAVGGTQLADRLVLKYCRETDSEYILRFRRETRLLAEFSENSKVVQVIDHNLEHEPPYYVMPFYPEGDLTTLQTELASDRSMQETIFTQMIDCVAELHARDTFHRDIKPQNFLRDVRHIRVSDLGLSVERSSLTAFTRSSQYWGTQGYLPPEFQSGGFKAADAAGDIFMLGKSFYVLLTGRDPLYLIGNDIPDALFHLVQKCCAIEKQRRYQTLAELKQAVVAVYDVLMQRVDGVVRSRQLLSAIMARLDQQNQFEINEVNTFLDSLGRLEPGERDAVIFEVPSSFYRMLCVDSLVGRVSDYLALYRPAVESANYAWPYAEVVADNMRILFDSPAVAPGDKAISLELAIRAAKAMNRFAAMGTCQEMIKSTKDDNLAVLVRDVLRMFPDYFVTNIEPVNCSHDMVASTIRELKASQQL